MRETMTAHERSAAEAPADPLVFEIGLSMSGAISAGAYTAGVFDFLILALDEWEKHRAGKGYDGPRGRVAIKAMVGASAGAITAAIGTVALTDPPASPKVQTRLYRAWVLKPTFVADTPGACDFLSLEDLDSTDEPPSVLNAKLLDELAADALVRAEAPAKRRKFISKQLHIYMTLTDLRGTPYSIEFTGGEGYHMLSHARRAHFVVTGIGRCRCKSPFADCDQRVVLDAAALVAEGMPAAPEWKSFTETALGSGAYPIGLAARKVDVTYEPVKFPTSEQHPPKLVDTAFDKTQFPPEKKYQTVTVDGGVIDNDPFEYARYTLMKDPPHPNERCGTRASRAVVMIAPFPEAPTLVAEGQPPTAIASIASSVLDALRQQVRFKPDQLQAVTNESVFSRFMISPKRVLEGRAKGEKFTIASGLLDGFGGFISKDFRDHDYQLGRRNCQAFLRSTFALAAGRRYFAGWTRSPMPPKHGIEFPTLPIIPLYGAATVDVACPTWRRLSKDGFETLMTRIEQRLSALLPRVVGRSWFLRQALRLGERRVLRYLRWYIMSDLIERNQISEFDVPETVLQGLRLPADLLKALKFHHDESGAADFVRLIASRLANPNFDYRCAIGIASSLGIPELDTTDQAASADQTVRTATAEKTAQAAVAERTVQATVADVLERLARLDPKLPIAAWRAPWSIAVPLYSLVARRPSTIQTWLRRLPLKLLESPKTDLPTSPPGSPTTMIGTASR